MGEAHDENAVVLGGVGGHADLFSTLADMELLGAALAAGGRGLLRSDTFALRTGDRITALRRAFHDAAARTASVASGRRHGVE